MTLLRRVLPIPRNQRSPDMGGRRAGANPPRRYAAPLPRGELFYPLLGGVAEGRGGFLLALHV